MQNTNPLLWLSSKYNSNITAELSKFLGDTNLSFRLTGCILICMLWCLNSAEADAVDKARVECFTNHSSIDCERLEQLLTIESSAAADLVQLYKLSGSGLVTLSAERLTSLLRKLVEIYEDNPEYRVKLAFHLGDDAIWESIVLAREVTESSPEYVAAYLAYLTLLKELTPFRLNLEKVWALRNYSRLLLKEQLDSSTPSLLNYFGARLELVQLLESMEVIEEAEEERSKSLDSQQFSSWEYMIRAKLSNSNLAQDSELHEFIWELCNPALLTFDEGKHCLDLMSVLSKDFSSIKRERPDIYSQLQYLKRLSEKHLGPESELVKILRPIVT